MLTPDIERRIGRIEAVVGQDVGRNIQALFAHAEGGLLAAARSIAQHPRPHVAIISGFYIPFTTPPAAENDGPVGVAHLAAAFQRAGIPCRIATDAPCANVLRVAALAAGVPASFRFDTIALDESAQGGDRSLDAVLESWRRLDPPLSHVIAIERCGLAADGKPHNSRGHDISAHTAPLDHLFTGGDWVKIGIGDGGNEVGMGSIPRDVIAANIDNGEVVACVTPCDHLLVLGVSNWGGYALPAALALLRPEWRDAMLSGLTREMDAKILRETNEKGPSVDGKAGIQAFQVDGLPWEFHADILDRVLAEVR
jgi:D-glutamate cyclase